MKGQLYFLATSEGPMATGSLMPGWAQIAASSGYAILNGRDYIGEATADLALIEGPLPARLPGARHSFIVDDGAPSTVLSDRRHRASAAGVLCPDPDRAPILSAAGLPAKTISPAIEVWRWRRPIRPAWPRSQIVVATDAQPGTLPGLVTLPLPPADPAIGGLHPYQPIVQAVLLSALPVPVGPALLALATGLPLVLPSGALSWLGPLAALRLPAEAAGDELGRLAREPAAWFDQVAEGEAALARTASPAGFLFDLSRILEAAVN